jgi:hypothetical protein
MVVEVFLDDGALDNLVALVFHKALDLGVAEHALGISDAPLLRPLEGEEPELLHHQVHCEVLVRSLGETGVLIAHG